MKWLNDENNDLWLMMLNNANDKKTFFNVDAYTLSWQSKEQESATLVDYISWSLNNFIFIIIKDRCVEERLMNWKKLIVIMLFKVVNAKQLLWNKLLKNDEWNKTTLMKFFKNLNFLSLIIIQIIAYINEKKVSLTYYLNLLQSDNMNAKNLLKQDYYNSEKDLKI